ncbi:hypothetical protein RUND412_003331 [Rhizina undulata]
MAEGLLTLLLFSAVMAIASFAAGMLPLAISLSPTQLRLISTVGMGVLVGTSMIVIIPEGIETLYSAKASSKAVMKTNLPSRSTADLGVAIPRSHWVIRDNEDGSVPLPDPVPDHDLDHDHDHEHDHEEENNEPFPHKWVGISLISGFILMYLIDVLPTHSHSQHQQDYIDLSSMSTSTRPRSSPPPGTSATTLGLVIHAAADGIALGASSTSKNVALEAIIFLAIMLHKAPAAFGLSAVLLRAGLAKRQARTHLIIFSLAAPVGALVTWVIVSLLGSGGKEGMQWWTGVLLLFSGGTFLYVAMHTMQEQAQSQGHKATLRDTGAAVLGMLLPLVTTIGHHHH